MDALTDNSIMLRVKAGDLDKMGLLFERHHRSLYGFLYHMTYKREASEDMAQLVFYKMLKHRHTYMGSGEFTHWMYSIARNLLKDERRKDISKPKQENVEGFEERISGGADPEEQFAKKEAKAKLYKALDKLSDDYREVLTLSRFQELKNKEIADILNITEGAVKVRIHRAMQELKNVYVKQEHLNR